MEKVLRLVRAFGWHEVEPGAICKIGNKDSCALEREGVERLTNTYNFRIIPVEDLTLRLIAVAVKTASGRVVAMPAPHRHWEIFQTADTVEVDAEQGFLTSTGKFVSREEGERIARHVGQLRGPIIGGVLTSEDLW